MLGNTPLIMEKSITIINWDGERKKLIRYNGD